MEDLTEWCYVVLGCVVLGVGLDGRMIVSGGGGLGLDVCSPM